VFETDLSVYWTHSNDRVPGSLEEETESLSTYQVETGVDHLLHQYRAFRFEYLEDIKVDREEVTVQQLNQRLVGPSHQLWVPVYVTESLPELSDCSVVVQSPLNRLMSCLQGEVHIAHGILPQSESIRVNREQES
jgi:hypothetical protein